jgi:hypothetical protein
VSLILIRANKSALVMFLGGGLIAMAGLFLFKLSDVVIMLLIGLAVITADLALRLRSRKQKLLGRDVCDAETP